MLRFVLSLFHPRFTLLPSTVTPHLGRGWPATSSLLLPWSFVSLSNLDASLVRYPLAIQNLIARNQSSRSFAAGPSVLVTIATVDNCHPPHKYPSPLLESSIPESKSTCPPFLPLISLRNTFPLPPIGVPNPPIMTGRHFDEVVRSSSSPSTGSSHGHAADTEMDAPRPSSASGAENARHTGEKRRESEPPPSQPPAKKKRTRTLTTPHQSAVLHALLAQV